MIDNESSMIDPIAQRFSLLDAPVLAEGRFDDVLARTSTFGARVKVYAEGGENATHTHLKEDHLFLVLAGQATFHVGQDGGETIVADRYEGVFLPRGAFYRFQSSGSQNLVLFRVGSFDSDDRRRVGPDGAPLPSHSVKNKHVDGVVIAGNHFGSA